MEAWTYIGLMAAGFAGGLVDAIAGGGGLITVPALLTAGLPPQLALGTNKLQSSCGTAFAVWRYRRAGLLEERGLVLAVGMAMAGGVLGALVVGMLGQELLRQVIPWLLATVAVYTACNRRFGLEPGVRRVPPVGFALVAGLALGTYDGFFGPGTGSFWMLALVSLMGMELRGATGYTKAANLASNVGSLLVFLPAGAVHFPAAGAMILGQLCGARIGSSLVIGKGAALIRPVFLVVVFLLTAKLLHDVWG